MIYDLNLTIGARECFIVCSAIHKLFEWSVTWNLNFSQSKCCYIQVGPPSRSCHHSYMLNSTVITSTDKQKDLGIWIDPNLSFHSHTHYTVSRANRILGLISKCFQYFDSTMMLSLYKTIVRPIVEYGNVIWGPHFAQFLHCIMFHILTD